jgi:hypothetical protein
VIIPPLAVTVMPGAGSTVSPLAGVIVSLGADAGLTVDGWCVFAAELTVVAAPVHELASMATAAHNTAINGPRPMD